MPNAFARTLFAGDGQNREYNLDYVPIEASIRIFKGKGFVQGFTDAHFFFTIVDNAEPFTGGYTVGGKRIIFDEAPDFDFQIDYEFDYNLEKG